MTTIEFNPHTRITRFDGNDFEVSGRDWAEGVPHWSEMIAVASKGLQKKNNNEIIPVLSMMS